MTFWKDKLLPWTQDTPMSFITHELFHFILCFYPIFTYKPNKIIYIGKTFRIQEHHVCIYSIYIHAFPTFLIVFIKERCTLF